MFGFPSHSTFWRTILIATAGFILLAMLDLFRLSRQLSVNLFASGSWMSALIALGALAALSLIGLAVSFSKTGDRLWAWFEAMERFPRSARWIAIPMFLIAVVAPCVIRNFLSGPIRIFLGQVSTRYLVLWFFALLGMYSLKVWRRDTAWHAALIATLLLQLVVNYGGFYSFSVTDYPFDMRWSETSRYYYPSLFASQMIYGQSLTWPILHPSLHLLLVPPYLFDAPLWVHRLWQVVIRFILLALVAPPLLNQLKLQGRTLRWLVGMWMFLYLLIGPVYFHLAVPIIIVLWGYSPQDDRRTMLALFFASVWSGLSRLNWYPVPSALVAILYLFDVPYRDKNLFHYLLKPALWFAFGVIAALASQRVYIFFSGIPDANFFYTSFTSDLLWYRLWPNETYSTGIIPGALMVSIPMWLVIGYVIWKRRADWHPLRLSLIFFALLVFLIGGILVSLKIGGGANLHNLDAYFSLLLVVTAALFFGRYTPQSNGTADPVSMPWSLLVLLIALPLWIAGRFGFGVLTYNQARAQIALQQIQSYVNDADAQGREILFISERHLISMHVLKDVKLFQPYEREELMEMAMAGNDYYLETFRADINAQRFAVIIVDPLRYKIVGRNSDMAEENNAWSRQVARPILCNYREAASYPEFRLAIYVPQTGTRSCP